MTASVKIDFNAGQASGVDELSGGSPMFVNVLVDAAGAVRSRPGVATWDDFPTDAASTDPVVAMAVLGDRVVYVTEDKSDLLNPVRRVYAWLPTGDVLSLSGDSTQTVAGTLRPEMAVARNSVIIAGGGAPQRVTTGLVSSRLGGSPPDFTDIVIASQFLVGVKADTSGQFFFAGAGEDAFETWDTGLDFVEAEYKPDDLVAAASAARELWAFGSKTLQGYDPDDQQVWAPSFNADVGISARRSIIDHETGKDWLDHNGRIVSTNGRDFPAEAWISAPGMDKTIQRLATVDDCWAFRAQIEGHDIRSWVFPTEGRTFIFDAVSRVWSEWFTEEDGERKPFAVHSHVWWPEQKMHLVGLADGTIGRLTFDAADDRGTKIRCVARTGFRSQDSGQLKDPVAVKAVFRQHADAVEGSTIQMRHRNNTGAWSRPAQMPMVTNTAEVRPAGEPYTVRQDEVSWTADVATHLTEVWEEVGALEA